MFHNSMDTLNNFGLGRSEILHAGNRINSSEFEQISQSCKFDSDVLNTTKLLADGTEIKDEKVETVIIHGISDIDTFVQATGRVRDKKINVYYKRVSKRSILAKLRYLKKQLFYFDEFERLGEVEFIEEYGIDVINKSMKAFYLDTVIDPESFQKYTRLKVHKTGLANLGYQEELYLFMDEYGFEALLDKYFPDISYIDLEQLKKEELIQLDMIDNFVDKKIFKNRQKELVDVICNKYGLRARNGSSRVGLKTINSFFEENNIPLVIKSEREGSRCENYKKTYWILSET